MMYFLNSGLVVEADKMEQTTDTSVLKFPKARVNGMWMDDVHIVTKHVLASAKGYTVLAQENPVEAEEQKR